MENNKAIYFSAQGFMTLGLTFYYKISTFMIMPLAFPQVESSFTCF